MNPWNVWQVTSRLTGKGQCALHEIMVCSGGVPWKNINVIIKLVKGPERAVRIYNGFDHIARVVSMVVFLPQLCWSQFVNARLCQVFQVSLCYRKNLWSRELFGKWRHNRLAKGNAHRVNNAFSDKAAWQLSRTHVTMPLMNCARVWYRTDQEFANLIGREPGLSFVYLQSLLISLINVCTNIYVIWNRKLITAQLSTENTSYFNFFVYFFLFCDPPCFNTGHR